MNKLVGVLLLLASPFLLVLNPAVKWFIDELKARVAALQYSQRSKICHYSQCEGKFVIFI